MVLRRVYRAVLPLGVRRLLAEARLRRLVRRGRLVHLHEHYPHYDVSPAQIDNDVDDALINGMSYARDAAALLGRRASPAPDLAGLRVLEVGPGLTVGSLLVCAAAGAAEVAALDAFPVRWRREYHEPFYARFAEAAQRRWPELDWSLAAHLARSAGEEAESLVPIMAADLADAAALDRTAPVQPFDAVVSNAALEHVPDLPAAARQLARLTRRGGAGVHLVDFRQHCDPQRPLEFLTMPDERFGRLFARRGGREGNRVRAGEVAAAFRAAGFEVCCVEVLERADPEYVLRLRPRMLPRFAHLDMEELLILSARFKLRRSGNGGPADAPAGVQSARSDGSGQDRTEGGF